MQSDVLVSTIYLFLICWCCAENFFWRIQKNLRKKLGENFLGSPVEVCHNDGDGEGYAENLLSKLVIYTEQSKKENNFDKN